MGRPLKNDADYFPHDKDMRNNPKIRAIRQKHGIEGYAIWCMLIESLTDCDNFKMPIDDITIEVLAGEYGIEQDVLNSVLQSFRRLKLIQYDEHELFAPGLLERMQPLLIERARKRAWAANLQNPETAVNEQNTGFLTSKMHRVKESKVNKSVGETEKNTPAPDPEPLEEKEALVASFVAPAPGEPEMPNLPPNWGAFPPANTPDELLKALLEFYKRHPEQWRATKEATPAMNWPDDKMAEVMARFCAHIVGAEGHWTYRRINARLKIWFKDEPHMGRKELAKPANNTRTIKIA